MGRGLAFLCLRQKDFSSPPTGRGIQVLFFVKFIIIVQELETWLLADEGAISKVTQSRPGKTVVKVNESLESIIHPKEKLLDILSDAGVAYTSEVAREIAKESDLSKIEYRCPKFKKFRQAVVDC